MIPSQRARSRLKTVHQPSSPRRPISKPSAAPSQSLAKYLHHLPLLTIAATLYLGLFWFVTNIRPEQVKNLVLPNSFLPLHALLLAANFFLFAFLTLSKRWGIFITLAIQWLIFLRLQAVALDIWALLSALLIGVGGWLLRTLWKNKSATL